MYYRIHAFFLRSSLILLLLASWVLGATSVSEPSHTPACVPSNTMSTNDWGLGGSMQLILPSRLPEFITSATALGPILSIPIGSLALISSVIIAPTPEVNAILLDTSIRIPLGTAYLPWQILVGAHYLHYWNQVNHYNYMGLHFGPALLFSIRKDVSLELGLKIYLQSILMAGVSGGLIFSL